MFAVLRTGFVNTDLITGSPHLFPPVLRALRSGATAPSKRRFSTEGNVLLRRVSRLTATIALSAALALTAACGESSTESNSNDNASSGSDSNEQGVGIAFDVGGRDDHSFNESAARGGDQAIEELGVTVDYQTARNGETDDDRIQRLTAMAEAGYNPVIGVGYLYDNAILTVAEQYPDTTFAVVDSAPRATTSTR